METKNAKPVNVNIDTNLRERLKTFCLKNGHTIKYVVEQALIEYLEKREAATKAPKD